MPEISWTQMRHLQQFFVESIREHPQFPVVISEGDSWFAYPIYANIIDQLDEMVQRRMSLLRLENSGDDLTQILNDGGLHAMTRLMDHYKPDVLLFSAGGNDIAGPELLTFVAERTEPFSAEKALATDALADCFARMKTAYKRLIDARNEVAPECLIVTHGYGRAIPTGKGAHYLGFSAGPWLKPFLVAKKYVDVNEQQAIVDTLIGRFNVMLDEFASAADSLLVKVDLSGVISDGDWSNELHPTRHGFENAARAFHARLRQVRPAKFP
jgi:hypothetical protein